MLYEREATATIADVCEKLVNAATEHKFGVLGIHDLKQRMAAKGVDFGPACLIVEVCNPQQAKTVLETNMSISTALPCRISIFQRGEKTVVSTLKPRALLGMFGNSELDPVARDVEETLIRIINAACE